MVTWDVQEMQEQLASILDNSSSAPTAGGTDWNIRLNLLNRAQLDWAEVYDWRALLKTINTRTSVASSNATITLPSDFRKLASFPEITWDGSATYIFPEVDQTTRLQYADTDPYVSIIGNPRDNYTLILHPASIVSGASIYYTYFSSPASLASAVDQTNCPDPSYLVEKAAYYFLRGREDTRYNEALARSEAILSRLVENENTRGEAFDDRVKTVLETKHSFRIGRD